MTPQQAYETAYAAMMRSTAPNPRVKMEEVARAARDANGYTLAELRGDRRIPSLVAARHEAWLICREMGFSLPEIGAFWHRDHTSIKNGIARAKERREQRKAST